MVKVLSSEQPKPRSRLVRIVTSGAGIRLLDLPSRYGFHLLVAAELGATGAGQFYIVFSVMTALAGLGRLGIDRALVRQISIEMTLGRHGAVRQSIEYAYRFTLFSSAIVTAALAVSAWPLAHWVLYKPELTTPLILASLSIIPQNLGVVAAGALAGLTRVGVSQMIYSWAWPSIWCFVTLVIGTSVPGGILLIAGSFAAVAIIGVILLWRHLRMLDHKETSQAVPLFRLSLSLFTTELAQLMISSAPVLILGIIANDQTVGIFALSTRIALIVNVVVSGVSGVASPRYAEMYVRGDRPGLTAIATHSVALALLLSVGPVLVMLLFPGSLLDLFGPGYSSGRTILCTLALGQLSAALFATMPELLGMTAHADTLRRINMVVLMVLTASCLLLVPPRNGEGAALATSLATVVGGVAAAWAVRKHLGITPLKGLAAAVNHRLFL